MNEARVRGDGEEGERIPPRRRSERAAALITTLIAIAVLGLLSAGLAGLTVSHYSRATTEQDASKALNYAEAALNYQIQQIGAALANANGNTVPNGTFGTAANIDGTDSGGVNPSKSTWLDVATPLSAYLPLAKTGDYCAAWVWNVPGTTTFNPYATNYDICGSASYNGIVRTVCAKSGGGKGTFDDWAIFGETGVELIGNYTVNGVVGTNGALSMGGSSSATGTGIYGSSATTNVSTTQRYKDPVDLPTIFQIANEISGGTTGIDYFKTTNDNAALGTYTTKQGKNTVTLALPTNGNLSVDGNPITLTGKSTGANFYLNNFDGQKIDITADISAGPVNLWIESTNAKGDAMNSQAKVRAVNGVGNSPTLTDAKSFHIYYRNAVSDLHLNGGASFYAMFYAIDQKSSTDPTRIGTVDMNGNATYNGAVYAHTIAKSNGTATVNYPSNPGVQPGEGIVFYGVKTGWREVNPPRGNH